MISPRIHLAALQILLYARLAFGGGGDPDEGACCLPYGECQIRSEKDCLNLGGEFHGVGSRCGDVHCPMLTCSNPDAGDCFVANGGLGCNDEQCCLIVCAHDGFCCQAAWDGICAAMALQLCIDCQAVTCTPKCLEDLSGDGNVGPEDLASLLAAWTPEPSPVVLEAAANLNLDFVIDGGDLAQLLAAWGPCKGTTVQEQEPCGELVNEGCAAPALSGSSCCQAHEATGCDQPQCQAMVCANDPFCCRVEWDGGCASAANTLCGTLCDPSPDAFDTIVCGQTVCGTIFADNVVGVDWYQFVIDQPTMVTMILTSGEMPAVGVMIRENSCASMMLTPLAWGDCRVRSISVCLPAGVYRSLVRSFSQHLPCDSGLNAYTLTLICDDSGCTPSPDDCGDAVPILNGETYFSTIGATTDGLPVEPNCQEAVDIVRDIWFVYEATCTGVLTASTCNLATFNTRIAIYESCDPAACPPTNDLLLACNDNATGCGGGATISAPVIEGQCYRIRIGGQGGSGIGLIGVSCEPSR